MSNNHKIPTAPSPSRLRCDLPALRHSGQKARDISRGGLPTPTALDTDGLDVSDDDLRVLLGVDTIGWRQAIPQIREHYAQFGSDLPAALTMALDTLDTRLN